MSRPWSFVEQPFLSIVIPAYNEERRIIPTLQKLAAFLPAQGYSWEVLVVSDGSTDATGALVLGFVREHPEFRLVAAQHHGKGHAVKTGMLQAAGQFRFLCDADLAMPAEELPKFLPPHLTDVDVAIGSREASGSRRFDEPGYRHFMGRGFNLVVRVLSVKGIKDTQCGFKCFTAPSASALFGQQRLDGFGFDVEVLFLAQRAGLRIEEVPINWYHQRESKVRPIRDTLGMLLDAVMVRWNYLTGVYRVEDVRKAGLAGVGGRHDKDSRTDPR